jgi:hypothetical protein
MMTPQEYNDKMTAMIDSAIIILELSRDRIGGAAAVYAADAVLEQAIKLYEEYTAARK